MCKDSFIHLHCHTDASPDGLGTVESRVNTAYKLGQSHLAMTDHGTLANTISFVSACENYDIVPIIGLEPYLLFNEQRFHFTLLSTSEKGYFNLVKLNNASHENIVSGYPCMNFDMISNHDTSDIIALTGCPASATYLDDRAQALMYVDSLKQLFNKVYLEIMFVDDGRYYDKLKNIISNIDLDPIITNDVHYNTLDQELLHPLITECRKGYAYDAKGLCLFSSEDMSKLALQFISSDIYSACHASMENVKEQVRPFNLFREPYLPNVENSEQIILDNCLVNMSKVYKGGAYNKAFERFSEEFSFISDMKFLDYFYIVYDLVNYAKRNDIRVGYGRGSAAGCIVSYLLGITDVDPIKYDLPFARFLNKARDDYPDIDIDFESAGKQQVVEYANKKYGALPIATYSRYSHNSLCDDIGRVLKFDFNAVKNVKEYGANTASQEFANFCKLDSKIEHFYNAALGQQRHKGKHAGGIVIYDRNNPVPIEKTGSKNQLTVAFTEGYDKELSKVGLVKIDILAIQCLDQLKRMEQLAKVSPPKDPNKDLECLSIFRKGDLTGIFQWSSDTVVRITKDISPETFEDLITINALNRPGSLDAGTAQDFHKYKINPRKIESRIDKLLEETYGVIVFQEQVISMYSLITGGSLEDGDLARRILSPKSAKVLDDPKWKEQVKDAENLFFSRGLVNGFSRSILEMLWRELKTHSRYSFNKAHSTCYAKYAYDMAWYKYNYPVAFFIAMLESDKTNRMNYLFDLYKMGYIIKEPNINISKGTEYVVEGKHIYLPFCDIQNMSEKSAEAIIEERERGLFESLSDLFSRVKKRVLNSRVRSRMYDLGSFDGLDTDVDLSKELNSKYFEPTKIKRQLSHLNVLLPSEDTEELFHSGEGWLIGIITGWKDKVTNYGSMRRFFLSPVGTFWCRENYDLFNKNDIVKVKVNNCGKLIKISSV